MVKQMVRESFYDAKQHKGRVIKEIVILVIFVLCALCSIPHLCICSLIAFAHIKKWDCEKEHMPEMTGFLPMSQNERQQYMSIKSYTKAIGLSGLLFLSFIYIAVCSGEYICDDIFWWNGGCQVISFYFYICLLALSVESAKWRRMKAGISKQSQGTLKSAAIYAIFVLILISIFWWCSMDTFRTEQVEVSATTLIRERVITFIFLVIQYVSYRSLKTMMLKEFIYSDYNAKIARNQEVDYEY